MQTFSEDYLDQAEAIIKDLPTEDIDKMAEELQRLAIEGGRLFLLGIGGSASNCSHAANDFRKLCEIESYSIGDCFSEISARTNDEGWDQAYFGWLRMCNLTSRDALMILSVGGGTADVSAGLAKCLEYATCKNATVLGIVGRDGGYTAQVADFYVIVPEPQNPKLVTPLTEAMQSLILHLLCSHPKLQRNKTKW